MNLARTRAIHCIGMLLLGNALVVGCAPPPPEAPSRTLAAPWSLEAPAWGARGHLESSEISECSGIVRGRLHPDVFWVHNDSDDLGRVFAIGSTGELRGEVRVEGADHVDWEDIAADDAGNLYICDVGNNRSDRQDLVVYVIPEPDPGRDSTVTVKTALPLRYPEQTGFPDPTRNFDCEAVFWREGKLYFLTKHRSDATTCLYRMDDLASETPQDLVLEEIVEVGSMVTGADLSPDGKELAVLCYGYLYLFEIREGRPLLTGGQAWRLPFEARQSESIAHDETVFWIVNEQSEIHLIDRAAMLRASASRRPGAVEPFIAPLDVPEALAWGYRPRRARLELREGQSVLVPVHPARGQDGEPAPAAHDSLQASLVHLGKRLRLDLRWPTPSLSEDGVPIAYVAWGPRSDRRRLDPEAGDRSVRLVVRGGRVVADALAESRVDLEVDLRSRPVGGLVAGSIEIPLDPLASIAFDLILLAPGGGEWSWGGEWSMRAPLKPWLWGTITSPKVKGAVELQPPIAKKLPVQLTQHGHVRTDDYYWMNRRDDPEVSSYLEAENAYTKAVMSKTEELQEALFEEIKGRIKQTDATVPYRLDGYWYYTRYEEGQEYPVHCRKKGELDADEEVMLDLNEMARGHEFFSVSSYRVSSGQNVLAYAEDPVGRREYVLRFKNLDTGETYPEKIPMVSGSMAWANDNETIFYVTKEEGTLRAHRVYRHVLGTDPSRDEMVFDEADSTFSCYVHKTKSKKYIMIGSHHTLRSEVRFAEADDPRGKFWVFLPREGKHEYDVDHFGDFFYIRSNEGAKNFRLMRTPLEHTGKEHWEEVIGHRDGVLVVSFDVFRSHLVVVERKDGLRQLRVLPWDGGQEHYLDFGEAAYDADLGVNPTLDTDVLRYEYSSMTTPNSVFDYDMNTRDKKLLKQDEVLGGFDSRNYVTERLYAEADDGVRVPISLVYRKGLSKNGESPLLLYGYGSYGYSLDASFVASRLSLIDRGFVYAIAHVRGGQEMGRQWYEDGKLLQKRNTFTDFIDCAEHLVKARYTAPENLFAMGGSAGGLLVGAVVNMRPDLFHGVVAQVPFVDVVTTMLDESIPLTTSEFDEWGDPRNKTYYDIMLSYSPYDNVEPRAYPHLLVMAGLHDSQVQYWEPAKWVARLRAVKTGDRRLLLKTNMEAGHGGASGRYDRYRETAFIYAFLLDLVKGSL